MDVAGLCHSSYSPLVLIDLQVMKLAEEAAGFVTSKFQRPIKLEFEKVYWPYLLINKKRYAGLYWTNPNKYDKMDTKGIVTVRRDNCPLVVNLINTCLHKLLIERNVDGAVEFAKKVGSWERWCRQRMFSKFSVQGFPRV